MFHDRRLQIKKALLVAALVDELEEEKARKRRRIWVHEINLTCEMEGEFHTLYPILRQNEERFFIYFRMSFECFDEILEVIKDDIRKEYTNFRRPIEPAERLAVTLRFLATGDSYSTIGHSFRVGFTTVGVIVKEVSEAIWKRLQPNCMPEPTTEIWQSNVDGFNEIWNFPNCIGCIDGKHVTIKAPDNSGSNYYCYLNKFSIVLMAIVDHDYKFVCIDVGSYGKNSDGGIFEDSLMGQKFINGSMNLPGVRPLPNTTEALPCVLLGDEAFALSSFLMRPYPYKQSRYDRRKEKFNYNLCRTRRLVENAFGILAQKWRLFFRPIELNVNTTMSVVKTACIIHNFLRIKKCDMAFQNLLNNNEEEMLQAFENLPAERRRGTNFAFKIRETFADFFSQTNDN